MKRTHILLILGLFSGLGLCLRVQAETPTDSAPLYQMQAAKTKVHWASAKIPARGRGDLVNAEGEGVITRFWGTFYPLYEPGRRREFNNFVSRALVVNIYWDGAEKPAVSAPLADFFCQPLELQAIENEFFTSSNELCLFDCSIPMPFRKSARIELVNDSDKQIDFFYLVHVDRKPVSKDALYLHAYWLRQPGVERNKPVVVLPKIVGKGRYLGVHWAIHQEEVGERWLWYDRRSLIFTDKEDNDGAPTLKINSIDDYLLSGWWSREVKNPPYSFRTAGRPYVHQVGDRLSIVLYRYHVKDPIWFHKDLSYSLTGLNVGRSDWSSTTFFYLDKPENTLPKIQDVEIRTKGFEQGDPERSP